MTKLSRVIALPLLSGVLATALPVCALAGNGFYLTGYGMESFMMGGADVAVSRDAFAANNNPSGMTQLNGQSAEFDATFFENISSNHSDSFGNYRKSVEGVYGAYASTAYARKFENTPYAAGVSLAVQGGVGWTYSGLNVNPAFGGPHKDDASALFTIIKLSPAVAYEVNDNLSLGVALGVNYLSGDQELFPNTSSPGFAGFRFKGARGIGFNSKWGLQYRPAKDVTIGLTYGTKVSIPLKDGTLRINYSDASFGGLGVVRYDNAKLTGLRLPEELALGIAFRPVPSLLVSIQDKWYNWSEAIGKLQLSASNPRTPGAPAIFMPPQGNADFRDQHVIEIGLAYDYDKDTTILAGINHGSRPLPDQNTSAIFSVIQARHYMLGAKRKIDKEWYGVGGFEFYPLQSVTYDSPVFGSGANERHYAIVWQFAIGRNW